MNLLVMLVRTNALKAEIMRRPDQSPTLEFLKRMAVREATSEVSSGSAISRRNCLSGTSGPELTKPAEKKRVNLLWFSGLASYAAVSNRSVQPVMRRAIFATGAATVLAAALTPKDRFAQLLPRTRSGGEVVFSQESPGGTVAVVEQRVREKSSRRLYIQGVSNSGDTMTSLRYMRLQALLPLLIHRSETLGRVRIRKSSSVCMMDAANCCKMPGSTISSPWNRHRLRFYEAALDAYRGERGMWADDLGAVTKADPTNPYYRWIAGQP